MKILNGKFYKTSPNPYSMVSEAVMFKLIENDLILKACKVVPE